MILTPPYSRHILYIKSFKFVYYKKNLCFVVCLKCCVDYITKYCRQYKSH